LAQVKRGGVVTLFCTAKNVTKKTTEGQEVWNKPKDNRRPAPFDWLRTGKGKGVDFGLCGIFYQAGIYTGAFIFI